MFTSRHLFLQAVAVVLALAYFALALVHVYWALGGRRGTHAAIPHRGGEPAFRPGRAATAAVAAAIACCSGLLLAWMRWFPVPVSRTTLRVGLCLIGTAMLLRALGDFRYVGLFRRIRNSAFARMDRLFYTPASLAAGVLLFLIALAQ